MGMGGFTDGSVVKNPPANAGDIGSIPESGRPPRVGDGNPLQCSCLGNPMDRGTWWAAVHGVTELDTTSDWTAAVWTWESSSREHIWGSPWAHNLL